MSILKNKEEKIELSEKQIKNVEEENTTLKKWNQDLRGQLEKAIKQNKNVFGQRKKT